MINGFLALSWLKKSYKAQYSLVVFLEPFFGGNIWKRVCIFFESSASFELKFILNQFSDLGMVPFYTWLKYLDYELSFELKYFMINERSSTKGKIFVAEEMLITSG